MLFRILTEDTNRAGILEAADAEFDAFTSYEAVGSWRGAREASYVLEVTAEDTQATRDRVFRLARIIKAINKQEAVLVQEIRDAAHLI